MSTTAAHPISGAVARMHSLLDELAEVPTWSMGQAATAEATSTSRGSRRGWSS